MPTIDFPAIFFFSHNFSYRLRLILLVTLIGAIESRRWRPCIEIKRELRVPCQCAIVTVATIDGPSLALEVNCDRMVLADDALASLAGQPIIAFSQRLSGHQSLPASLLKILPKSLTSLDLSGNAIHSLMERQLQRFPNLSKLLLADNALGDNLNPIFSSNEFRQGSELTLLDLRYNGLRSIEEGILKGCPNLQELYLDYNNFTTVPSDSLKGPEALRVLGLSGNNIGAYLFKHYDA